MFVPRIQEHHQHKDAVWRPQGHSTFSSQGVALPTRRGKKSGNNGGRKTKRGKGRSASRYNSNKHSYRSHINSNRAMCHSARTPSYRTSGVPANTPWYGPASVGRHQQLQQLEQEQVRTNTLRAAPGNGPPHTPQPAAGMYRFPMPPYGAPVGMAPVNPNHLACASHPQSPVHSMAGSAITKAYAPCNRSTTTDAVTYSPKESPVTATSYFPPNPPPLPLVYIPTNPSVLDDHEEEASTCSSLFATTNRDGTGRSMSTTNEKKSVSFSDALVETHIFSAEAPPTGAVVSAAKPPAPASLKSSTATNSSTFDWKKVSPRVEYDPTQPQYSPSYDPDPYFNEREYNPAFPDYFV